MYSKHKIKIKFINILSEPVKNYKKERKYINNKKNIKKKQ